jgi:Family of unknown function (DUF6266)
LCFIFVLLKECAPLQQKIIYKSIKKVKKMGTYNKGILGAFSGKVGPVVGASWRGKDVMRSLPRKTNRVATAMQLLQREKFTMVTEFLTPLNSIVGSYFGNNTGDKTRRNQAMSYLMKEAISFEDPNLMWLFSKVLISRGDLLGLNTAVAVAGTSLSVDLTWADNSGQGDAETTDKLVVVLYEETTKTVLHSLNVGSRAQGTGSVIVPAYFSGLKVQIWATFASSDDKMYATSQYLGAVVIA